jgi:unsaturated rhamnogalacturonyl hydrolase
MNFSIKTGLILFLIATGYNQTICAQNNDFKKWPDNKSPKEIGLIVAQHFVNTPHTNFGSPKPPGSITYPEVCAWYGALSFARETGNKKLAKQLADRFEPIFSDEKKLIPKPNHVDNTVFGAVPFELYIQTHQAKYLELGTDIADKQWALPENPSTDKQKLAERGLTWQTRMWIDDMFMITLVQTQAYRATKDHKYIDRAAKEMVVYLDELQKPNGLFYHAPDVPFFWGRGNGWMAAGMTEVLRSVPADNPDREKIMAGYKKMMASLLNYQAPDGMWRQLIDDPESWGESSCTGMFTYAMVTGVKYGWLDQDTYGKAARKGWIALTSHINANGDITDVCEGTNKKNDRQYYLDRKRITGDLHGQAPVLWSAFAFMEKK